MCGCATRNYVLLILYNLCVLRLAALSAVGIAGERAHNAAPGNVVSICQLPVEVSQAAARPIRKTLTRRTHERNNAKG